MGRGGFVSVLVYRRVSGWAGVLTEYPATVDEDVEPDEEPSAAKIDGAPEAAIAAAALVGSADDEDETAVTSIALDEDGAASSDELQELAGLEGQDGEQDLAELNELDEVASDDQELPAEETIVAVAAVLGAAEQDNSTEEVEEELRVHGWSSA